MGLLNSRAPISHLASHQSKVSPLRCNERMSHVVYHTRSVRMEDYCNPCLTKSALFSPLPSVYLPLSSTFYPRRIHLSSGLVTPTVSANVTVPTSGKHVTYVGYSLRYYTVNISETDTTINNAHFYLLFSRARTFMNFKPRIF